MIEKRILIDCLCGWVFSGSEKGVWVSNGSAEERVKRAGFFKRMDDRSQRLIKLE